MKTTPAPHPLRWIPPFVVGFCLATAAEIAMALLVYSGPGLMRSVTTVIAVEAAALGIGLWTAPRPAPDLVDTLRRRWLVGLVAFLAAALYGASWSFVESIGSGALDQGLGLALVAAFPLYAAGSILGAMGTLAATEPSGPPAPVGGPVALGAAVGFAATGASLPHVLTPASLLLVCLVLLSAGGLVYGSVLDARLRVHVVERLPSPLGDVRVEDRHLPLRDGSVRLLFEGRALRRWTALGVAGEPAWDEALLHAALPAGPHAPTLLLVGGGASTIPAAAGLPHAGGRLHVFERSSPVVELAGRHLGTGLTAGDGSGPAVSLGNPEDLLARESRRFDLVVVDTAALEPVGGPTAMSRATWAALARAVAPGGFLAFGPLDPGAELAGPLAGWRVLTFRRSLPPTVSKLGDRRTGGAGPEETIAVAFRPAEGAEPPREIEGFLAAPDVAAGARPGAAPLPGLERGAGTPRAGWPGDPPAHATPR